MQATEAEKTGGLAGWTDRQVIFDKSMVSWKTEAGRDGLWLSGVPKPMTFPGQWLTKTYELPCSVACQTRVLLPLILFTMLVYIVYFL